MKTIKLLISYSLIVGMGYGMTDFARHQEMCKAYAKSLRKYKNVEVQYTLARCYLDGIGVSLDTKQGVEWLKTAAKNGHKGAQEALESYGVGHTVPTEIYFNATLSKAEQGDVESIYNVGSCYSRGTGVNPDQKKAFEWYKKSAEQGLAEGQHATGLRYIKGKGVERDEVEALKWFKLSAEQDSMAGQYELALCYLLGEGVRQNSEEAFKWLELSAKQGYMLSQYELGSCYLQGDGVKKDKIEAVKWLNLAAKQGDEDARKLLNRID